MRRGVFLNKHTFSTVGEKRESSTALIEKIRAADVKNFY